MIVNKTVVFLIVGLIGFCNSLSIQLAVKAQSVFFIGKVLALMVIIVTGIVYMARGKHVK